MLAIKKVPFTSNTFKKERLTLVVLLFSALALFLFYVASSSRNQSRYAQVPSFASKAVNLTPEERAQAFNQWKKDVFAFSSINEAMKVGPFEIKEPKHPLVNGSLAGVYLTKDENINEREVYLYYGNPSNPIVILERKTNPPVDYHALYTEMIEWKKRDMPKMTPTLSLLK